MAGVFVSPSRIVSGNGSLEELGTEGRRHGTRALLVTGRRAAKAAGITGRAGASLREAGVEVALFDQAPPEPDLASVDAGRAAAREHGADVVVGIGGGSALDVAKAIAGLAGEAELTAAFHGGRAVPEIGLPIVAVPTTSGSGAEVTPNAVLSDPANELKQSIRGTALLPRTVILDPELTVPLPPDVTAASGMDALTQAVESFWSTGATPLTEALSWEAARLIDGSILAAFADGTDLAAREAMAYGSLMAGLALAAARLGCVHGMAHPLGWRLHLPHGLVCAVLLPHVVRLNRKAAPEKYDRLAGLFGTDPAEHVESLLDALQLPRTLGGHGLVRDDFVAVVAESMPSGSLKANPKPVTEADVEDILNALL